MQTNEAGIEVTDTIVGNLEKSFKGTKFARNMKQVRLKVDLMDFNTKQMIASSLSSEAFCDYTNSSFGPLDLVDVSPLKSCMRGKEKVIILSERTLPKDVEPIFQIWCGKSQMKDLEKHLVQPKPTSYKIRPLSISFTTPSQNKGLDQLDLDTLKLKLVVRRIEDQKISNSFTFKYFPT